VLIAALFLVGLVFGSFANVVIHRVPAGESLVRPPSRCPACGAAVQPRDNIPVVSWLLLRGRCRSCGARISPLYPAVELACGALFAAVGWGFGLAQALPAVLVLAWTRRGLAVIAAPPRKIPNRLTYPLTPVLAVLLVGAALASGEPWVAVRVLLGGAGAFAFLLLLAIISPRGMGMGDVKLAAFIGLGLGYLSAGHVILGVFGGFLLGGTVALVLLVTRLRGRKDPIPFGPYLAAAGVIVVLAGDPVIEGYLGLVRVA
jgi:leader peptidase (prepilin peptidase) / N-methyltransferase